MRCTGLHRVATITPDAPGAAASRRFPQTRRQRFPPLAGLSCPLRCIAVAVRRRQKSKRARSTQNRRPKTVGARSRSAQLSLNASQRHARHRRAQAAVTSPLRRGADVVWIAGSDGRSLGQTVGEPRTPHRAPPPRDDTTRQGWRWRGQTIVTPCTVSHRHRSDIRAHSIRAAQAKRQDEIGGDHRHPSLRRHLQPLTGAAIAQRFGEVHAADARLTGQIGERAGDAQHAVIAAR